MRSRLSNVLGIIMMQFRTIDILLPDDQRNTTKDIFLGFGDATLYTVIFATLVYFHILNIPDFLTDF